MCVCVRVCVCVYVRACVLHAAAAGCGVFVSLTSRLILAILDMTHRVCFYFNGSLLLSVNSVFVVREVSSLSVITIHGYESIVTAI